MSSGVRGRSSIMFEVRIMGRGLRVSQEPISGRVRGPGPGPTQLTSWKTSVLSHRDLRSQQDRLPGPVPADAPRRPSWPRPSSPGHAHATAADRQHTCRPLTLARRRGTLRVHK